MIEGVLDLDQSTVEQARALTASTRRGQQSRDRSARAARAERALASRHISGLPLDPCCDVQLPPPR
eukprot:4681139-Pleurochrysis_carterae.AAC.1